MHKKSRINRLAMPDVGILLGVLLSATSTNSLAQDTNAVQPMDVAPVAASPATPSVDPFDMGITAPESGAAVRSTEETAEAGIEPAVGTAEDAAATATSDGTDTILTSTDEANGQSAGIAATEAADSSPSGNVVEASVEQADEDATSRFFATYFAVLYGPSVKNPSGWQPTPDGKIDEDRPILVRNYLGVGYDLTDKVSITPTAYWLYRPVMGQELMLRDPFLRISHSGLIETKNFNLYGDLRFHVPVSDVSKENDLKAGVQSFQIATWNIPSSRFTVGTYSSARFNYFGKRGSGSDLEFYVAPYSQYKVAPTVSLSMLYEIAGSHTFGDKPWQFVSDGTDLEPGVIWEITPTLMVNPYLNVFVNDKPNLDTTSVGLILSWRMI